MSITRHDPNTVFLGGEATRVNDLATSETLTPGHLLERFNNGGITRVHKHDTAGGPGPALVCLEHSMVNDGVDDTYAANDLVEAAVLHAGATAWMFIASGQNIAFGDKLESAGDGTLRITNAGTTLFTALENKPNVAVQTRIRVEAV